MLLQKLGNFYRYNCSKATANKARVTGANPLDPLNVFRRGFGPPRRPQLLQVYSNVYYDERIKSVVQAEQKRVQELQLEEPFLRILRRVTKKCWEDEDEDTRAEIEDTVEELFDESRAQYEDHKATLGEDSVAVYEVFYSPLQKNDSCRPFLVPSPIPPTTYSRLLIGSRNSTAGL